MGFAQVHKQAKQKRPPQKPVIKTSAIGASHRVEKKLQLNLLDGSARQFYEDLVRLMTSSKHGIPKPEAEQRAFKMAHQTMKNMEACKAGDHSNCKSARCDRGQ